MIAFDTLAVTQDLEAAGMNRRQAQAVAQAFASAGEAARGDLATRADLLAAKADMRADMAALKADMAEFKADVQTDVAALEKRVATKDDLAAREIRMARFGYGLAFTVLGLNVVAMFGLLKLLPPL